MISQQVFGAVAGDCVKFCLELLLFSLILFLFYFSFNYVFVEFSFRIILFNFFSTLIFQNIYIYLLAFYFSVCSRLRQYSFCDCDRVHCDRSHFWERSRVVLETIRTTVLKLLYLAGPHPIHSRASIQKSSHPSTQYRN
jgi:hypothetical protein